MTIIGTKYYYRKDFISKRAVVTLKKDFDNEYNNKAIAVYMEGLGYCNSPYTVIGESISSRRPYDRMKKKYKAKVLYNTHKGIVAEVL
ncbi:MAG: HIRAN domain-containing protein [Faecalibacillus sp.]